MAVLSAIVAHTDNRVIGRGNTMPWHMPADLQHFKRITLGKPVIMGRKTFDSIGRALPGRENIVVSRQPGLTIPDVRVVSSVDEALSQYEGAQELIIIGGGQLYAQSIAQCSKLYVTEIHIHINDGDVFFPPLVTEHWREVSREEHKANDRNPHDYSFVVLERIQKE